MQPIARHYNLSLAKKPQSVRRTLGEFFGLMIRDSVDMVGGDFNQAHTLLPEILDHHCNGTAGAPTYRILQHDQGAEVVLVLFSYPNKSFYDAELRCGMTTKPFEEWGLKPNDRDTHLPLVAFLSKHPIQDQPRSSLHQRSLVSIQARKKKKQTNKSNAFEKSRN